MKKKISTRQIGDGKLPNKYWVSKGEKQMENKDEKGYNGWTNYETWACYLWMTNDEGSYDYFTNMALEIKDDEGIKEGDRVWKMADRIKESIEEANPLIEEASMYSDLLNSAIGRVDFREIAEHFLED